MAWGCLYIIVTRSLFFSFAESVGACHFVFSSSFFQVWHGLGMASTIVYLLVKVQPKDFEDIG